MAGDGELPRALMAITATSRGRRKRRSEQADGARANVIATSGLEGIATRQILGAEGGQVDRVSHDARASAASVIDGQGITEASLLWRHPTNQRTLIALTGRSPHGGRQHLNYNEAGGTHRAAEFGVS